MFMIHVRAIAVRDNNNGTFSLELPSREMTPMQRAVIADLFPNVSEKVYSLLSSEALLSAMVEDYEAEFPPAASPTIKGKSKGNNLPHTDGY